jgi:hypothetical protein
MIKDRYLWAGLHREYAPAALMVGRRAESGFAA